MTAFGKAREWKRAVALLDTMRKDGLEPTTECYNAAVAACGVVGQVRSACSILYALFEVFCLFVMQYIAVPSACEYAAFVRAAPVHINVY
jgi:pentatricopeptide repeat protein